MKKLLLATTAIVALASGAQAADLGVPRAPVAAAIMAPSFSWTGFYLGANIGLGIANTNYSALIPGVPGSGSGLVGGLQAGYNWQINNVVLGLEGDFGYFGTRRTGAFGVGSSLTWRTQWDASIRGRLGVAVDRTLLYVTGGVGFADIGARGQIAGAALVNFAATQTRVGFQLGAGVEHAVTQNVSVRAEYLYGNYGRKVLAGNNVRLDEHKFRVGVNFLFLTGPSAVVARY